MYTIFHVNDKDYELNFRLRDIEKFERIRKHSPLDMLMNIDNGIMPQYGDIIALLTISLEKFTHGNDMEKAKDLFEDWICEGHQITDFIYIIIELFQNAGILKKAEETTEEE